MGSRLLPLCFVAAALAAGEGNLGGLAFYVGLLAVPPAAAAAFVAISDALEGRPARLRAVANGLALLLVVVASAVRSGAPHGAAVPSLATFALLTALAAYALPALTWFFQPWAPRGTLGISRG